MIFAGVFEFCLAEGIGSTIVVMETWWTPRFLPLFEIEPLGLPEEHEGMEIYATRIPMTEDALASIKAAKKLPSGSLLVRQGLAGPAWPRRAGRVAT